MVLTAMTCKQHNNRDRNVSIKIASFILRNEKIGLGHGHANVHERQMGEAPFCDLMIANRLGSGASLDCLS